MEVKLSHPVVGFVVFSRAMRIRDLVVLVVPVDQVLHDGAALKEADAASIVEVVRQGGNPPIGIDFGKPGLLHRHGL